MAGPAAGQSDIWVMDLARRLSTRISLNRGERPVWSPDGKFVYYNRGTAICRKPADGSGEEAVLFEAGALRQVTAVSPDGKTNSSAAPTS